MSTRLWGIFTDEQSLAEMLPSQYAHFARPISDGLAIFLQGLRAADQLSILAVQANLPDGVSISHRLGVLARSSPVLHKLGQVLARDHRLPLELRQYLQQLESLPATISLAAIRDILQTELGSLDRLGITLPAAPLAEASVAVVVPFATRDAIGGETEGVFKVLKPGIAEQLEHELGLIDHVGTHLDERCDQLGIPHLDYHGSFQQVRQKLLDEVRLDREQRHLVEAGRFYADQSRVLIPTPLEYCTPHVTAMTRIHGVKITDHDLPHASQQRELAGRIARMLIAKPIFCRDASALFHCDPHAGNLLFTDDGRLAIIDWSLVGHLGKRERTILVQVFLSAMTLQTNWLVGLLAQLAHGEPPHGIVLKGIASRALRQVRYGQFPGFDWLVELLDAAAQQARLRVSGEMMLFRKTLLTLEGVMSEVGRGTRQSGRMDQALMSEFLQQFVWEWPERWYRGPQSREFATRLSNLDLARTMMSGPATWTRLWAGYAADLVESSKGRGG